ncbi:MAG TPA: hypothetical protein VN157_03160 [Caulobacter sp.]|nr:hypothetical protein [Caulobacter sp.]
MEVVVGTLTRPDGLERILVVKRADGLASYRRQFIDAVSGRWGPPGPELGLYDTIETAEIEARSRVWWLAT